MTTGTVEPEKAHTPQERLVYCSACSAEPGDPCTEQSRPIATFHAERLAHLHDLRAALVAPALMEAGVAISQRRRISGRRYANAEMFGQDVYFRGTSLEYDSQVAAKRLRFAARDRPTYTRVDNADRHALWERVRETAEKAVNSAYGTDPRHGLLAVAVADKVAHDKPLPWSLSRHFGRTSTAPTAAAEANRG